MNAWPESDFPPEATKERPIIRIAPEPKKKAERAPLDWADLATKEPPLRKWAIKGWFGFGHTTLLVGQGGIGKTLLSQQIASCLALQHPFLADLDQPLKVLMWACEDDHDELWRRQLAISRWLEAGLEAFSENLIIVPRHGLENALVSMEFGKLMFAPLLEELRQQALDLKAEVVILDNVAQLYGANENDRHQVTAFLNALAGTLPGLAVLLLAHPSRAPGSEMSGSGAWDAVVRTRMYLGAKLPGEKQDDAEPSEEVRYLAKRKTNYSQKDWRKFNYRDGVLMPEAPEIQGGIVAEIRTRNAEALVLTALEKLSSMGIHTTDGATSPRYLVRQMKDYKLEGDSDRKELAQALRNLMLAGKITRGKVGEYANRAPLMGLQLAG